MTGDGGRPGDEPLGSPAEEAAKLIRALQGWAKDQVASGSAEPTGPGEGAAAGRGEDAAGHGQGDAGTAASGCPHIADGSVACRICPLCQLIAFARQVNPATIDQLADAATALTRTLAGLAESARRPGSDTQERPAPVEKIDLADDSEPGDTEPGGPAP